MQSRCNAAMRATAGRSDAIFSLVRKKSVTPRVADVEALAGRAPGKEKREGGRDMSEPYHSSFAMDET